VKGPTIYVVVKGRGDGYGHNSYEHVAWFFSKREATEYRDEMIKSLAAWEWIDVEPIKSSEPFERDPWDD
jgi:hypothetical protein